MPNPFTQGLRGLLDTGMLGDIGTGLLSQSGYSQTPITIGQAFGGAMQFANQRQKERFELDAARQKLEQDKDRQKAMSDLQGMMKPQTAMWRSGPGTILPIQTPEGQSQVLGLLGRISPEQVAGSLASGLLGGQQPQRLPASVQEFQYFNTLPPELQQQYMAYQASQNALNPVDTARLAQTQLEMQMLSQQIASEQRTTDQEQGFKETNFRGAFDDLKEFGRLNDMLENTALQTGGVGLQGVRRPLISGLSEIASAFGADSIEYKQAVTNFDNLNAVQNSFINRMNSFLSDTGLSRTDSGRAFIAAEKPSIANTPEANRAIIGRLNTYLKDLAKSQNFDIETGDESPINYSDPNLDLDSLTESQLREFIRLNGGQNGL